MDRTPIPSRPQRQQVLILSHGDGHLEIFCGEHVECSVARVPYAHTVEGERLADAIVERMLVALLAVDDRHAAIHGQHVAAHASDDAKGR